MEPNNLLQVINRFSTHEACIEYFEQLRWNGVPKCGHCQHDKFYRLKDNRYYKCAKCRKRFNVLTGTVFHGSNIPLQKWILAIYMLTTYKKGVSSMQLSRDLGITQKTAWYMLHRIRELFDMPVQPYEDEALPSEIEVDETYVGGKNKNKHYHKKTKQAQGRNCTDKVPVFGIMKRGGNVYTKVVPNVKAETLKPIIYSLVEPGNVIMTDDWGAYRGLDKHYEHYWSEHGAGKYTDKETGAHTNNMECYWSHLKRGFHGTYIQISRKHLQRYLNEYAFRFNNRDRTPMGIVSNAITNTKARLPYKKLIA